MMRKLKVLLVMLCVLTLVMPAFAGCTDGRITIEDITITGRPTNDTLYFQPETTFNLDFTYSPDDLDIPTIVWESSNTSVATISTAAGIKVRQKGVGDTTITATVEGTTISDSFVLHIIEAPVANIKLDGETGEVGFSVEGSNVDPLMATVSADKNELTLDTGSAHSSGLGILLNMPAEKLLKKTQVYEVKLTAEVESLSVQGGEASDIEVRTGVQTGTDDWAHFCLWNHSATITSTGTKNFRGLFTTGSTDISVERWTALLFANPATTFKVASKLKIKDIELRTITSDDAFIEPENWKSSYTVGQMNNLHMVRKIGIYEPGTATKVENLDSALKTIYTSSDPTVFKVDTEFDGHITALKAGSATLSAHVVGIPKTGTPSGYLTYSKLINVTQPAPDAATKFTLSFDGDPTQVTFAAYMGGDATTELSHDGDELTAHTDGESKFYLVVDLMLPAGTTLTEDKIYDISFTMDIIELTTSDNDVTKVNVTAKAPETGEPDIAIWKNELSGDGIQTLNLSGQFTARELVENPGDITKISISIEPEYREEDPRSLAAKFVLKNVVVAEYIPTPGVATELGITLDGGDVDAAFGIYSSAGGHTRSLSEDGTELSVDATSKAQKYVEVALILPNENKLEKNTAYDVSFTMVISSLELTSRTVEETTFAMRASNWLLYSDRAVKDGELSGCDDAAANALTKEEEITPSGRIIVGNTDTNAFSIIVEPQWKPASDGTENLKVAYTLSDVVVTKVGKKKLETSFNGNTAGVTWEKAGTMGEPTLSADGKELTASLTNNNVQWNMLTLNFNKDNGDENISANIFKADKTYEISYTLDITSLALADAGSSSVAPSFTVFTAKTVDGNKKVWDNVLSGTLGLGEISFIDTFLVDGTADTTFAITVERGGADSIAVTYTLKDIVITEVEEAAAGGLLAAGGVTSKVTAAADGYGGTARAYITHLGDKLIVETAGNNTAANWLLINFTLDGSDEFVAAGSYLISFDVEVQKLELGTDSGTPMKFVARADGCSNEDLTPQTFSLGSNSYEGTITVDGSNTNKLVLELVHMGNSVSTRFVISNLSIVANP